MHAIVAHVTFKQGQENAAVKELDNLVIPAAKGAQGFKGGYWLRSEDGKHGTSVELYESADKARAEMARRGSGVPPQAPVTLDSIELFEVVRDA